MAPFRCIQRPGTACPLPTAPLTLSSAASPPRLGMSSAACSALEVRYPPRCTAAPLHHCTAAHIHPCTPRHTSAHLGTSQHTSAHLGTSQHTSAHLGTPPHTCTPLQARSLSCAPARLICKSCARARAPTGPGWRVSPRSLARASPKSTRGSAQRRSSVTQHARSRVAILAAAEWLARLRREAPSPSWL